MFETGAYLSVPHATRAGRHGSVWAGGSVGRAGRRENAELGSGRVVLTLGWGWGSHAVAARCRVKLSSSEGSTGPDAHSGTLTYMVGNWHRQLAGGPAGDRRWDIPGSLGLLRTWQVGSMQESPRRHIQKAARPLMTSSQKSRMSPVPHSTGTAYGAGDTTFPRWPPQSMTSTKYHILFQALG